MGPLFQIPAAPANTGQESVGAWESCDSEQSVLYSEGPADQQLKIPNT